MSYVLIIVNVCENAIERFHFFEEKAMKKENIIDSWNEKIYHVIDKLAVVRHNMQDEEKICPLGQKRGKYGT